MLKTYLYVPDELNNEVETLAKLESKSKAEIIRSALREGVGVIKKKRASSAEALLEIARIGKKNRACGPKDLSRNLDKYLWGNYEA